MQLRISASGRVRPSVRPSVRRSVRPYVPCYFRTTNMAVFEGEKSSNNIIVSDTMTDDEVVASDLPQRYLFSRRKKSRQKVVSITYWEIEAIFVTRWQQPFKRYVRRAPARLF